MKLEIKRKHTHTRRPTNIRRMRVVSYIIYNKKNRNIREKCVRNRSQVPFLFRIFHIFELREKCTSTQPKWKKNLKLFFKCCISIQLRDIMWYKLFVLSLSPSPSISLVGFITGWPAGMQFEHKPTHTRCSLPLSFSSWNV